MNNIGNILNERILVLDGAMGTMIESYRPNEALFRGEPLAKHDTNLLGCYDILSITAPQIIEQVHRQYLDAGADIITTNTFNAISLASYNLQDMAGEINRTAATLACRIANDYTKSDPNKPRFVAGSVGPTCLNCSTTPSHTATLYRAYLEQITALIAGGVDILLFETICDLNNIIVALQAAEYAMKRTGCNLPIMLSITTTTSDTMLSGHSIDNFLSSISHLHPLSVGINCSIGASPILPLLRSWSSTLPYYISAHPSAGLPNKDGFYDTTAQEIAADIQPYITEGLVNIVGGCCGTTPELTALLCQSVKGITPRIPRTKQ